MLSHFRALTVIEAVTCDPAGVALPASSVTTLAGGLRTRVNPGARPCERRATCRAYPVTCRLEKGV